MTLIASYISKAQNGKTSVALIGDSRLSWTRRKKVIAKYDYAPKLFYLNKSPGIFAYCGSQSFAVNTLHQICLSLDLSKDFVKLSEPSAKGQFVLDLLNAAFEYYPKEFGIEHTELVFIFRLSEAFYVAEYKIEKKVNIFKMRVNPIENDESGMIGVWGSGRKKYSNILKYMIAENHGNFSRLFFRSLVLLIKYELDPLCGGAPQMVVLPSYGNAKPVGIYYKAKTFLMGQVFSSMVTNNVAEFRNENYEFVDENGKRHSNSQRHDFNDWPGNA